MDVSQVSVLGLASKRLEWLSARQKVIAENVANADTPGYQARDVASFESLLGHNRMPGLAMTQPGHIGGTPEGEVAIDTGESAWGQNIDGNNVVLEEQTILSAETQDSYRLASQIYRKGNELLALAAATPR